jgi:Protein of unknown function (DUF3300)
MNVSISSADTPAQYKSLPRPVREVQLVTLLFIIALGSATGFGQSQPGSQAPAGQGQYNPPPPPPPPENQQYPEQQAAPPPARPMAPSQLDQLVSRIALYPDPLLAQVLTASTYFDQIPQAAQWADQHSNLKGDALANAIREDNLQWDASVMALLPFPSVLDMMADDPNWTQQLGDAVLSQRPEVMDAVQRMRKQAHDYGYLESNPYDRVVDDEGEYEIQPVNPAYIYVPVYDPYVVFAPPRPGFFIGGAIHFGPAIVIGTPFWAWGWAHPYFGWRSHDIFFDATPWHRNWTNRGYYVHSYARPYVHRQGPMVERHQVTRSSRGR